MNKFFAFVFFVILSYEKIYANGKTELPTKYIDIGTINVSEKYTEINLPYVKPDGIIKIIRKDTHGLIIDKIIADGKKVNVRKIFFSMASYEHLSYIYEEDVNYEEGEYFLKMNRIKTKDGILYQYFSRNEEIMYSPDYYIIPLGRKEIYIKYRVRLVGNELTNFRNYFISEKSYTIKFNLEWK
jgi:hypothetical protein